MTLRSFEIVHFKSLQLFKLPLNPMNVRKAFEGFFDEKDCFTTFIEKGIENNDLGKQSYDHPFIKSIGSLAFSPGLMAQLSSYKSKKDFHIHFIGDDTNTGIKSGMLCNCAFRQVGVFKLLSVWVGDWLAMLSIGRTHPS